MAAFLVRDLVGFDASTLGGVFAIMSTGFTDEEEDWLPRSR